MATAGGDKSATIGAERFSRLMLQGIEVRRTRALLCVDAAITHCDLRSPQHRLPTHTHTHNPAPSWPSCVGVTAAVTTAATAATAAIDDNDDDDDDDNGDDER